MEKLAAAGALAAAWLLAGCSGGGVGTIGSTNTASGNGNPTGSTPVTTKASNTALFQPLQGILPFPTDLYFSGSTDGTLNIQPANALSPNQTALNALDGFSTTAVIRASFGGAIDPTSLTAGSVLVIQVTTDNTTKATTGVVQPLVFGTDYTVNLGPETGVGSSIIEIHPTHPLMPSTCIQNGQFLGTNCKTGNGYLVFLTNGIKDTAGHAAIPDTDYANILAALPGGCASITNTQMNGICKLVGAHMQIAGALATPLHLDPARIVLSFSFTTQSINDTLAVLSQTATAQPIAVQPTGLSTKDLVPQLPVAAADVYVGTLNIPYYLSRTSPLTEYWHAPPFPLDSTSTFTTRFNPVPKPTETLMVPVLMTVPKGTKPAAGWPLVIFEHGITGNRTNMLPLGNAFAAGANYATIAIDLPLHGITDRTNPLYASAASPLYARLSLPASGSIERTFDLDVMNNTTQAAGADGVIDGSGSHFINLASLLTSRDNLREAAADLVTLAKSVAQIDLDGDTKPDIDPTQIHFVGHSLGAITGTTFLGITTTATATLAMPGGGVASLLRNSPTFGPPINQGLQAQSGGLIVPGTTLYEEFFRDAQTVVDSGDPWNYMAAAAALHRIHLIQVVGSSTSPADQVIPNFATQRLIDTGHLTRVSAPGAADTNGLRVYVNFTAGSHSSILDPTSSPVATQEMQTETVSFAASNGTALSVPNAGGGVVQP